MFCNPKWLTRLFLLILFISACNKEKSYELSADPVVTTPGGSTGGSAEFSFVANAGNCSNVIILGTYQVGKSINTGASLTVTVNVTKLGDWTKSTNTVNGIVFAGTGTFTALGLQPITLVAAGTPLADGFHTFALTAGNVTCSATVEVLPAQPIEASDYYYKITVDGKVYQQAVTINNSYEALPGIGGADDVMLGASISYKQPSPPVGTTNFTVTIGTMHHYRTATNNDFKAYFAPGTRTYTDNYFTADGVMLTWTDAKGKKWATYFGNDQNGSTFSIISITDITNPSGILHLKTKMQFTCKVYNVDGVMKMMSGEMVGKFGKI